MKLTIIKLLLTLLLKTLIENEKIIGIGETGLDFFYNNSDKDKQIDSFKEHIDAAIKNKCSFNRSF